MRDFKWRTAPTGVEGTATVYVDSAFGSDIYGDGTRANPYATLKKAWTDASTKPERIICRGIFTGYNLIGTQEKSILGDYYGAAIFDGRDQYLVFGFTHSKMIFRNCPYIFLNNTNTAGVGRAVNSTGVGYAGSVHGVAGSSNSLHRTALYMGYIGGTTAVQKVVYDTPQYNPNFPFVFGGLSNQLFMQNCTVYGISDILQRMKSAQAGNSCSGVLVSKFAMIANDGRKITYTSCLFAADVKWYWLSGNNGGSAEELTLTGNTSAERQASLLSQLTTRELASNLMPSFVNCIFSSQTAAELFNDAPNGDFTLIPGCDADRTATGGGYIGALPPAIRIPVLTDSTGVPATWDERSASGCLAVEDDQIKLDTESASETGEILSKILVINPQEIQLDGIYTEVNNRKNGQPVALWKDSYTDDEYQAGDTLPVGRYVVYGSEDVTYEGETIAPGGVVVVSQTGTTFSGNARLIEIVEPNVADVVYCRCRSVIYARVSQSDSLQRGATYLNDGNASITYHNRTIAPGESFVCMIAGEQFTASSNDYTIAVMFDDSRVPASEWVPAQFMGEYFVSKSAGAIEVDDYGVPYGSGNYMSYQGKTISKATLDKRYVQFCIKARRYGISSIA